MARYGFRGDAADMKSFILFVMSRSVDKVTFDELTEMTLIDENIDYFAYFESVGELVESGHLSVGKGSRGQDLYSITPRGRTIAGYMESGLPFALRRAAEKIVAEVSERVRRNACIVADVVHVDDEPMARLILSDGYAPVMNLEIVAGSDSEAEKICRNFRRSAESIFNEVSMIVRKTVDP